MSKKNLTAQENAECATASKKEKMSEFDWQELDNTLQEFASKKEEMSEIDWQEVDRILEEAEEAMTYIINRYPNWNWFDDDE